MKAFSYSHTGKRTNNEDYIKLADFAYVLCDGVGGIDNGEIASKMVSESFIRKVAFFKPNEITSSLIRNIVIEVQTEFNQKAKEQPLLNGIGTTFCAAVFTEKGLICAHIGDSRIYVIDTDEEKYWRTTDHSISSELIKSGIIKQSGYRNHPMANQLTRAIQVLPETELAITDIQKFKYVSSKHLIFLCSDGVNEVLEDIDLVTILCSKNLTVEEKFSIIQNNCKQSAKDNNSAILIQPVIECNQTETQQKDENIWMYLKGKNNPPDKMNKRKQQKIGLSNTYFNHNRKEILIYSVLILVILVIIFSLIFQ
jgi:PPM family protein phosphatase